MHHPLHRHQHIARIHLAGDEIAGGQVGVIDAACSLVARRREPQVMRHQPLAMGAWDHLHAAVLCGCADERDPEVDDQGLARFRRDQVGQVLVPWNVHQRKVRHLRAQRKLGMG